MSERPVIGVENRLLALLPQIEFHRLLPNLEIVSLDQRQVLYEPGTPVRYVYFPILGVLSWLTLMQDGSSVEVATVGNEGMISPRTLLGADTMPDKVIVQVRGQAMRMKATVLKAEAKRGSVIAQVLYRYLNAFLTQIIQSVACNILHSLEQRCCRWLLMTHDRVKSNQFPLTHQFLAQMLGVRRASVTVIARRLQKAGLIHYIHGKITILDRRGLESTSCQCYGIVKRNFDRILGSARRN